MILQRQYMIAGALLLLFVVLTIPVNFIISSKTGNLDLPRALDGQEPLSLSENAGRSNSNGNIGLPQPADPAQYNIRVQKEDEMPVSQGQWDFDLRKVVIESKVLTQIKSDKTFSGIQISNEEYKDRVKKIEAQIEQLEKVKADNPSDMETYRRLQSLYMLRSTLRILKSQVVKEPRR